MPKVAHDFSKEIIFYIIKCNDVEKTEIYVGSTFSFVRRKYQHKNNCINPKSIGYNLKQYVYIRENGGWDNFTMTMIDRKVCVDMLEARKHEQTLITQYKASLNTKKAYCSKETISEYKHQYYLEHKEQRKQYYTENFDKIKEQKQQYNIIHAEAIKERQQEYYIENFDKIKEQKQQYNIIHAEAIKERQKLYNIIHADEIKKHHKQYRIEHPEKFKEKVTCECGIVLCRELITKQRHIKTKKHQAYLATKESVEIA